MSILSDRLAAIRAARLEAAPIDQCPRSDCRIPSTLATFLILYNRASKDCCIDYSYGAKALHRWLTYPNLPLDYEVEKYPWIADSSWKVPASMEGYETSELAAIISGETYGTEINRAKKAIAITTADLVMRGIL